VRVIGHHQEDRDAARTFDVRPEGLADARAGV
jgi:hypothetical protein